MFNETIFRLPTQLGDRIGMPYAISEGRLVRFDPTPTNHPGLLVVTGEAGSGKTVLAQILAHHAAHAGMAGIYIGNKGIRRSMPSDRWEILTTGSDDPTVLIAGYVKLVAEGGGLLIVDDIYELAPEWILAVTQLLRTCQSDKIAIVLLSQRVAPVFNDMPATRITLRHREGRSSEDALAFVGVFVGVKGNEYYEDWIRQTDVDVPRGIVTDFYGRTGRIEIGPLNDDFLRHLKGNLSFGPKQSLDSYRTAPA